MRNLLAVLAVALVCSACGSVFPQAGTSVMPTHDYPALSGKGQFAEVHID